MLITRNIRLNTDLHYVMLHHSEHFIPIYGLQINNVFIQNGFFGIPYDIIINADGTMDISPRWSRAARPTQYQTDVTLSQIFSYNKHDIGDVCSQDNMNYQALHVLVIGDFDKNYPTLAQKNTLTKLIQMISKKIPTINNVIYHSDLVNVSCPGINFPKKSVFQDALLDIPGEFNGIGNNTLNVKAFYPTYNQIPVLELIQASHKFGVSIQWPQVIVPSNTVIQQYNIYQYNPTTNLLDLLHSTQSLSYTDLASNVIGTTYTYYVSVVTLQNGATNTVESQLSNPVIATILS